MSGNDNKGNNDNDLFTGFTTPELIRLGYSYAIFIFIAIILIKFQPNLEYAHKFPISGLYVVLTFIAEILWIYAYGHYLRVTKNTSARDTIHNVLHNILPIGVLVFGYIILIDGFRHGGDFGGEPGGKIEFYMRGIIGIVFIGSYIYLFYKLMVLLSDNKVKGAFHEPVEFKENEWADKKDRPTKYDNLIDILYNLFQPISIIIIAFIMYVFIRSGGSGGGGGGGIDAATAAALGGR